MRGWVCVLGGPSYASCTSQYKHKKKHALLFVYLNRISINQITNQPTNQSTNQQQPTNQPTCDLRPLRPISIESNRIFENRMRMICENETYNKPKSKSCTHLTLQSHRSNLHTHTNNTNTNTSTHLHLCIYVYIYI